MLNTDCRELLHTMHGHAYLLESHAARVLDHTLVKSQDRFSNVQVMQGVALMAAVIVGGTAWRAMKRWRSVETVAELKR